jgi:hypothetical protein
VIQGIWNITGDGLSNPDVENYSVHFEPSIDPETYSATLIHFLPSKRHEDQHRLRLAVNSTSETFSLDFTLNSAFTTSMGGTRHFYGVLPEPDVTFSFVSFTKKQRRADAFLSFGRSDGRLSMHEDVHEKCGELTPGRDPLGRAANDSQDRVMQQSGSRRFLSERVNSLVSRSS